MKRQWLVSIVIALSLKGAGALATTAPPAPTCAEPANTWIQNNAPGATALGAILARGAQMDPGAAVLCSPLGQYVAIYQGDGNFVVYNASTGADVWSTGTWGQTPPQKAIMQSDCDFMVYKGTDQAIWHSNTWRAANDCYLQLQDDSNLVVLGNPGTNRQTPVWSWMTGTAPDTISYAAEPLCLNGVVTAQVTYKCADPIPSYPTYYASMQTRIARTSIELRKGIASDTITLSHNDSDPRTVWVRVTCPDGKDVYTYTADLSCP